ncbi:MAG: amidase [Acidobacteria bacterium]|nr:amidase [Acidobacteriota bacterium]
MPEEKEGTTRREFMERSAIALAGLALAANTAEAVPAVVQGGARAGSSGGVDLPNLTIVEAAERIRTRQLSAAELTEAVLRRIDALNPKLGAFITVVSDQAMEAARAADRDIQQGKYLGPLHGIPVGVKDTHYTKGILTTAASPVLKDFIPDFDCTNVERLRNAGAILVGKTNLPEFSFGGTTPGCQNPWDLSRNAGGSSGGSGSALAASLILGATGGDTSGSIRIPASVNGCVGLKPTFGQVSRYGVIPISWTLDHLGPMAKTVEDTAILLNALAGHDPKDGFSARVPAQDYRSQLRRDIRGMRIGYMAESEIANFFPETRKAFFEAVKVFESLGARVQEVTYPERMRISAPAQRIIRISEAATYHRQFLLSKADQYKTTDSNVRTTVEAGWLLTARQYLQCQRARRLFIQDMAKVLEPVDVLLSPTTAAPAGVQVNDAETNLNGWNLCGFPAISLCCGFSTSPAVLPIGLHIAAMPFQDATVLAAAFAYESATDMHRRHPNL